MLVALRGDYRVQVPTENKLHNENLFYRNFEMGMAQKC